VPHCELCPNHADARRVQGLCRSCELDLYDDRRDELADTIREWHELTDPDHTPEEEVEP
jgi:hypothetical protein